MSDSEQELIYYAYINRPTNYIGLIMDTFHVERAQAYRNIETALQKYCRIRYGV